MKHFNQLFKELRGCEVQFVGERSLPRLAMYLRGYAQAVDDLSGEGAVLFLAGFGDFVRSKFNVTLSKSWEDVISFQCANQLEALETFWTLFDEYSCRPGRDT